MRAGVFLCECGGNISGVIDLEPLAELVAGLVRAGFVRDSAAAQLVWTKSVDEALAAVERGWAEAGIVDVAEPTAAEFLEAEP